MLILVSETVVGDELGDVLILVSETMMSLLLLVPIMSGDAGKDFCSGMKAPSVVSGGGLCSSLW